MYGRILKIAEKAAYRVTADIITVGAPGGAEGYRCTPMQGIPLAKELKI